MFEARLTASLDHTCCPAVYAIGRYPDHRPFYAMQYIDGDSLQQFVDGYSGQDLDSRETYLFTAVGTLARIADCLAYSHQQGFVHRDVKPHNIMLDRQGRAFLLDWGLARCFEPDLVQSDSLFAGLLTSMPGDREEFVGTPAFTSPEQVSEDSEVRNSVAASSDIYSLGATLYYVLTNRPPHFLAESFLGLIQAARSEEIMPPSTVMGSEKVPKRLESICMRALQRAPGDRFSTAAEMGKALSDWLHDVRPGGIDKSLT